MQWVNTENYTKVPCSSNYNLRLQTAKVGYLHSGFTCGCTSQIVLETCLAADFTLEPTMPFGKLMFGLGGHVSDVTQDYANEKVWGQTSKF